ncbi:MAG: type II toxin-antitoxin system VapC family toxin [Bacillota bacterium]
MRVLLDTHVFLWWITDDERLSPRAREVMVEGRNTLVLSAASGWEMAVKAQLGRLSVAGDFASFLSEQLALNGIDTLPVTMAHALHVFELPAHHRDPFDRLLVAQALLEGMPIVTADPEIARYPVEVIW